MQAVKGVFYKKHDFKFGDYIFVKLDNLETGSFSFHYISSEKIISQEKERIIWKDEFEKATVKVIKEYSQNENCKYFNIDRELSMIYYNSVIDLLKSPCMTVGEVTNNSNKIEIINFETESIIWQKGKKYISLTEKLIDEAVEKSSYGRLRVAGSKSTGSLKTFDDVLEYMRYALTEEEVRWYIMDELFSSSGKGKLENVISRCFDGRADSYSEAKSKFEKLLQALWDSTASKYNYFPDNPIGSTRKKLLTILDDNRIWLRKLDSNGVALSKVPKKLLNNSLELNTFLTSSLDFISNAKKMTNKEAEEMKTLMEQAIPMFEMSVAAINKEIDKIIKSKAR